MAKRFTDTDKWKRRWFSELSTEGKLAWFYLLDECDNRGVWYVNFRRMTMDLNFSVTEHRFMAWFGSKIIPLDDDKFLIPTFIEFQYGETLKAENNAHKAVISLLEKYDIQLNELKKGGPGKVLRSPSRGAQDKEEDKDKDKDLDKDQEKEKNVFKKQNSNPDLLKTQIDACAETWKQTLAHFKIQRPLTLSETADIGRAIQRYGAECVDLALYGARFEPKIDGFDPKDYCSLNRILRTNKEGKERIADFMNWGAKAKAHKTQATPKQWETVVEEEFIPPDPEKVRALLKQAGF